MEVQDVLVRDLHDGQERRFIPPPGVVFEPVAISPDGWWLLICGFRSQTDIDCCLADLADPEAKPQVVTATTGEGFCEPVAWAADSRGFYVATNTWGGEFADAGYYSMADPGIRKVISAGWDIESLAVAADNDTMAWTVNQAGSSILHARRDGSDIPLPDMPAGVVSVLRLSQDGSVAALVLDAATPACRGRHRRPRPITGPQD